MAQQNVQSTFPLINVGRLGRYLDGWADLIEDRGDKAPEVKQLVYQYLTERHMPDIRVAQVDGITSIDSYQRPYNITQTHPGATVAIYVGQHGKDLFVSWRAYVRKVLHPRLYILLGIALLIGFFALVYIYRRMTTGLFAFMTGSGALLSGAFTAVGVAIAVLVIELLLLWGAGLILRHNGFAFFYVTPNRFDIEDITAMLLSVHKSVLRALDKTGIAADELRLKQQFKGGTTDETV